MRVLFYLFFVCISAYANVYFKTTIIKQNIKIMLPVRGPLRECRPIRSGASGLPYYCAPLVCISVVIELLAVWRHNKPKTTKKKTWYLRMRMSTLKQHWSVRGPLRECRSIRSGASGLPYYCTPLVCISAVNRLLAVWLHNKLKTKKPWRFTNSSLGLPHAPSLSVYLLYESVSMYEQPCPYAYPPFPSASSFLKFLRIYM